MLTGDLSGVDARRWCIQSPLSQDLYTERFTHPNHGSRRHLCVRFHFVSYF